MCGDEWDDSDAHVACRQLGYPAEGATILIRDEVFDGTGPIWLNNVNCDGNEDSLFDCNDNTFGNHNCEHFEDVGVTCRK